VLKKFAASMALAIGAWVAVMSLAHADALDDIRKAGKIRIAIDLGVPPYGMTDDNLQPTGLDVEAARLLAKDWGLEFEHVPTTGASRIPALQTGKADLVISSLSYTAERAKVIDRKRKLALDQPADLQPSRNQRLARLRDAGAGRDGRREPCDRERPNHAHAPGVPALGKNSCSLPILYPAIAF